MSFTFIHQVGVSTTSFVFNVSVTFQFVGVVGFAVIFPVGAILSIFVIL